MNTLKQELQDKIISENIALYNKASQPIIFSEIKTGTGKTKIFLESATALLKKTGKSILISTSNNFLALEYLREAKKFNMNGQDISVVIGKNNYLNAAALDVLFLDRFNLNEHEVNSWVEDNKDFLLISLFIEHFCLPEEAEELLVSEESETTIQEVANDIVDTPKIYITNHYYFLYLLLYAKNESFFNLSFLVDEVHALNGVAKTIFSKSFSPFRLSYLLKKFLKDDLKKTDIKKISGLISLVQSNLNLSRSKAISLKKEFGTPPAPAVKDMFDSLRELVNSKAWTGTELIIKKAKDSDSSVKEIKQEMSEAKYIVKEQKVEISFSTIKMNISYSVPQINPIYLLRKLFINHKGFFWGISGTLRVEIDDSIQSNKWSFERLGFFNHNKAIEEKAPQNDRLHNLVFKVYSSVFKKNMLRYYLESGKRFSPPKESMTTDVNKLYEKWIENLAELAKKTFWKNGLILMSSFENIELMEKALQENGFTQKYKIFSHKVGTSMRMVIKNYREAIDAGESAVLIGGLGFYTGIDLHGDYLSTLFIGKLPIEPKRGYFSSMKIGEYSVQAELRKSALLTFRQGIGRAIRTETDRALIVVADPRILGGWYTAFKDFIDEAGVKLV